MANELLSFEEGFPLFLASLAEIGRKTEAARIAGINYTTLMRRSKKDSSIDEAVDHAMEIYRDTLRAEVHRRGVKGIDEPLHYRGELTGAHIKKYDNRLLELELKRHCPEYREKVNVDHAVSGGVLVLGGTMATIEGWADKHGGVIDVEVK